MYVPVGGTAETIKWYEGKCVAGGGIIGKWYCDMAEQLRKTVGMLKPPPLPEPPAFVARKTPPADVTEGSAYQEWFQQQQAAQQSKKQLLIFAALGVGALLLLKRKKR